MEDGADDEEADQRVEDIPSRQPDRPAAQDDAERHPGIAQHVPKGAADIQVVLCAALQQQCDAEIGRKARGGDAHDPLTIDRDRLPKPMHAE